MSASLCLIARSGTVTGVLGTLHIYRVKLVSFSQLWSAFRIRFPFFRSSSITIAYCCRRTRHRSEFPRAGIFLDMRYANPIWSFITVRTYWMVTSMRSFCLTSLTTASALTIGMLFSIMLVTVLLIASITFFRSAYSTLYYTLFPGSF